MHFLAKAGDSTCKVMNLIVVSGYYGGRFTIFTEILKHGITGYWFGSLENLLLKE